MMRRLLLALAVLLHVPGAASATGVVFGPEQVINSTASGTRSAIAADLDGDGDLDALSASVNDDTIAWYENTDGQGTFGPKLVITTAADFAATVAAADVDGDGDLDVLASSQSDDTIAWYENTDGQGTFGSEQVITAAADGARSVVAADIDGDGDLDVLAASGNDDTIAWFANTNGLGSFGTEQVITATADGAITVFAADLDGEGDLDVLTASTTDGEIRWYENTNGLGSFALGQVLWTGGVSTAIAADVDDDGDLDVLSSFAGGDTIAWHENTDGLGSFGPQQVITTLADFAAFVSAVDLDQDGDLDAVSASQFDDEIAWYENADGQGSFGPQQILSTAADGARSVVAADIDRDGDADLLTASNTDHTIAWYENQTIHRRVVWREAQGGEGPRISGMPVDVDGDGDLDVLEAGAWHENVDGRGAFGPPQPIPTLANSPFAAADIDGDGDPDVVSGTSTLPLSPVAWHENTDGQGSFGPGQPIAMRPASEVFAADVDGDGDMDVVSVWSVASEPPDGDELAWHENMDGQGGSWTHHTISAPTMFGKATIFVADLDGDADLDVMLGYVDLDILHPPLGGAGVWYENTDGQGSFGPERVISTGAYPRDVSAADLDGDGDLDAILWSGTGYWYENTNGQGSFGLVHPIGSVELGDLDPSAYPGDLDGDGDLDILAFPSSGDLTGWGPAITWNENTDGEGSFGPTQTIWRHEVDFGGSPLVVAADLDGDGDLDVLSLVRSTYLEARVNWFVNDGRGRFGPGVEQVISKSANFGASAVAVGDLDGDADLDAVSAGLDADRIVSYRNDHGTGIGSSFASGVIISSAADGPSSVFAADVDGDGDRDLLAASSLDHTLAWYENTNGQGSFGTEQAISTSSLGAASVVGADVDRDGDVDALLASSNDNTIAWFENDGVGGFGPEQVITNSVSGASSVHAADLDGDGDVDALAASPGDDTIAWYANTDGEGSFGTEQAISTNADDARSVTAADVDRDGDSDVLAAAGSTIAWYENLDGQAGAWSGHTITSTAAGARSVFTVDLDHDGDLDVLSASADDDTVAWYENTDGLGSFGPGQVITGGALGATSVLAGDIDRDGDPDALSASAADHTIAWHENRSGQVQVFTASTAPALPAQGAQVELLRIEVTHLGRAGDADAALATLVLSFDGAPGDPVHLRPCRSPHQRRAQRVARRAPDLPRRRLRRVRAGHGRAGDGDRPALTHARHSGDRPPGSR
jgi:hypothetical protein